MGKPKLRNRAKLRVLLETTMGNITIELYKHASTTGNFENSKQRLMTGIFHRVIPDLWFRAATPQEPE
jgi:cyclophilin family peptidyl-prolyl cis-trans isomerase